MATPARESHRPVFARFYAWVSPRMEPEGMGELRDELLAGVAGRVVEVGAGNGLNFGHYPPQTTAVFAVEPEPYLRRLAKGAAADAPVAITVTAGVAGQLPFPAGSFDVGVVSLVLCAVDNQRAALAELYRVIRPAGQLRFLEHVPAQTPVLRGVQRARRHALAADRGWVPHGEEHTRGDPRGRVRDHDPAPPAVSGQPHPRAGSASRAWDRHPTQQLTRPDSAPTTTACVMTQRRCGPTLASRGVSAG